MGICGSKEATEGTQYLLQTLVEHTGGINCVALSEDGSVLATGSEDTTARLWTTKSAECECIGVLAGHTEYLNCVCFKDVHLITGSADKTIRRWDVTTCDCLQIYKGHTSLINRIICTGDFIFSSSYDRTARCWDFDLGDVVRIFNGHKRGVYPLLFITGDETNKQNNILLDDSDSNKDIIITGSADFTAKLWSFESGKCVRTFQGHTGAITCLNTDSVGKTLFTGSTDFTVRSWSIRNADQLQLFEGHQGAIICLLVSNKLLFTGSSDHTVRTWVAEFGNCTRTFKGHKHTVSSMRLHNGFLVTTCGDGTTRCYDSKSGALRRAFVGHTLTVNGFKIVNDKLFTVSHDRSVRVWNFANIENDIHKAAKVGKKENAKKRNPVKNTSVGNFAHNSVTGNTPLSNSPFSQSSTASSGIVGDDEKILIEDNLPSASVKNRTSAFGNSRIEPTHILSHNLQQQNL